MKSHHGYAHAMGNQDEVAGRVNLASLVDDGIEAAEIALLSSWHVCAADEGSPH